MKTTTVQSTSIGSRGLIDYAINGVSIFVLFLINKGISQATEIIQVREMNHAGM